MGSSTRPPLLIDSACAGKPVPVGQHHEIGDPGGPRQGTGSDPLHLGERDLETRRGAQEADLLDHVQRAVLAGGHLHVDAGVGAAGVRPGAGAVRSSATGWGRRPACRSRGRGRTRAPPPRPPVPGRRGRAGRARRGGRAAPRAAGHHSEARTRRAHRGARCGASSPEDPETDSVGEARGDWGHGARRWARRAARDDSPGDSRGDSPGDSREEAWAEAREEARGDSPGEPRVHSPGDAGDSPGEPRVLAGGAAECIRRGSCGGARWARATRGRRDLGGPAQQDVWE